MTSDQLEAWAQTLTATGDYRIIRRLKPRPRTIPPPGTPVRLGLMVDVETTGLDPQRDEIIELAMTPFTYGLDGTVFSVEEGFQGLRQPSEPISPEITAITGITNEMVAGQVIDPAEVPDLQRRLRLSSRTTRRSTAAFLNASAMCFRRSRGRAR